MIQKIVFLRSYCHVALVHFYRDLLHEIILIQIPHHLLYSFCLYLIISSDIYLSYNLQYLIKQSQQYWLVTNKLCSFVYSYDCTRMLVVYVNPYPVWEQVVNTVSLEGLLYSWHTQKYRFECLVNTLMLWTQRSAKCLKRWMHTIRHEIGMYSKVNKLCCDVWLSIKIVSFIETSYSTKRTIAYWLWDYLETEFLYLCVHSAPTSSNACIDIFISLITRVDQNHCT